MNSSATVTGCDDIIKRLRDAIAEHPLSPIHGYAADIAALLDRLDTAERENERLRAENEKLSGEHSMMRALLLSAQESSREDYADAERYRWLRLRDNMAGVDIMTSVFEPDALDAAIDAAMAAERPEGRMNWIKTSERLPKDGQEVLAYYGGERIAWEDPDASRFVVLFCGPLVDGNHARIGTYWSNDEHSVPAPTHWQPLPEPPSDERREG